MTRGPMKSPTFARASIIPQAVPKYFSFTRQLIDGYRVSQIIVYHQTQKSSCIIHLLDIPISDIGKMPSQHLSSDGQQQFVQQNQSMRKVNSKEDVIRHTPRVLDVEEFKRESPSRKRRLLNATADTNVRVKKSCMKDQRSLISERRGQLHEPLLGGRGHLQDISNQVSSEPKDMRMTNVRFFILFFACLIQFANNYAVTQPDSISREIKNLFDLDNLEYNYIQAAYSLPNIVLCILAGLFIDKYGLRSSIVLFTLISIIGLMIFSLSVTLKSFDLAIIGRAVFGVGAEAQNIWIATIISIWFYYGEISFASAMIGCVGKFGSVASDVITPLVFRIWGSIEPSFWISVAINVGSLAVVIINNKIEKDNETRRNTLRYNKKYAEVQKRLNPAWGSRQYRRKLHWKLRIKKSPCINLANQIQDQKQV